jgi:hypothetical protein
MPKRRDAELAIGVARRQQRFWSRAWLLGPAIALVQVLVTPITWVEGLLLAAWGSLLLGMMAAWWWTRARRAEMLNLAAIGPRGLSGGTAARDAGRGTRPDARRPSGHRSRLPEGRLPTAGGSDGRTGTNSDDRPAMDVAEQTAARPRRPRGRKRR